MGNRDKRERRIRQNPNDVPGAELKALLEAHGFACRPTSDGWQCRHPSGALVNFPIAHGTRQKAGTVRPTYVQAALRAIDGLPEEE